MFSVPVNDTDGDGLLDVHESSGGWKEPNDRVLPDIHAMAADPVVKDAFIEIGYMNTPGFAASTGHGQGTVPLHSHRPTPAALKMVGDTLWCGGVAGCNAAALGTPNSNGVRVHFDVGSSYPAYTGADLYAERYIVRTNAKGGEEIRERFCEADSTETCRFPAYPARSAGRSASSSTAINPSRRMDRSSRSRTGRWTPLRWTRASCPARVAAGSTSNERISSITRCSATRREYRSRHIPVLRMVRRPR